MEDSEREQLESLIEELNETHRGKKLSDEEIDLLSDDRIIYNVKPQYDVITKHFKPLYVNFKESNKKAQYAAYPILLKNVAKVCEDFEIQNHRDNFYFIIDRTSWMYKKLEEEAKFDFQRRAELFSLYRLRERTISKHGNSVVIDGVVKDWEAKNNWKEEYIPKDIKNNPRKLDNPELFINLLLKPFVFYINQETSINLQKEQFLLIAQLLELLKNKEIIYDKEAKGKASQRIKNRFKKL